MPRFGYTQPEIDAMRDEPIFLMGTKPVGIVLLHGWTSYPRQVKALAEYLHAQGYWVSVPMLKGHGTQPEDLEQASWKDWVADAKQAVTEMKARAGVEKVIVGGTSMGGNLALLASQKEAVDGIILIGTPVHLRNHFSVWLGSFIPSWVKRYQKKRYPKKIRQEREEFGLTAYLYFPMKSASDCLAVIRKSVFSLHKITAPTLIVQTSSDWLVTKYSPWVIYNAIRSKVKELLWVKSETGSHINISSEAEDFFLPIKRFIERVVEMKQ